MSVPRELTLARSRLRTIKRHIDTLLSKVDPDDKSSIDVLEDLLRRGEHVIADGYPPRSMGDGTPGGSDSTPTEARALRLAAPADTDEPDAWEEHERDLVSDALREFVLNIDLASHHMDDNDKIRRLILSVEGRMKKRQADLGDCECCGRTVLKTIDDPMKAGYCTECFDAWETAGRPDRIEFKRTRVVCTECGRSTDDWEVLDRRNYHRRNTGPGCFWKAYNRTRGRRGA